MIHGYGTGQLRRAIAELPADAAVRRQLQPGAAGAGRRRRDGRGVQGIGRLCPLSRVLHRRPEVARRASCRSCRSACRCAGPGSAWKGLCPFHGEKTPSFNVNEERRTFKCFGCGVGGDVIKFIELYDKITFPEAVRQLAGRVGLTVPEAEESKEEAASQRDREALLKAHEVAAALFREQLQAPARRGGAAAARAAAADGRDDRAARHRLRAAHRQRPARAADAGGLRRRRPADERPGGPARRRLDGRSVPRPA